MRSVVSFNASFTIDGIYESDVFSCLYLIYTVLNKQLTHNDDLVDISIYVCCWYLSKNR